MIGPPPMCDIRNVQSSSILPTGNVRTVDLSTVTVVEGGLEPFAQTTVARGVSYTPTLPTQPSDVYGNITASDEEVIPLALLSGGTAEVPLIQCQIALHPTITPGLYIPFDFSTVDAAATILLWNSIDPFNIITDYPV